MKTVFSDFDPEQGIATRVHQDDGKTVIEKTYDAEPLLEYAAAMRQNTQGESWGEGRIIGTVPMAIVGQFMRQDGGIDTKRLTQWIRENPAFICFDRFS